MPGCSYSSSRITKYGDLKLRKVCPFNMSVSYLGTYLTGFAGLLFFTFNANTKFKAEHFHLFLCDVSVVFYLNILPSSSLLKFFYKQGIITWAGQLFCSCV